MKTRVPSRRDSRDVGARPPRTRNSRWFARLPRQGVRPGPARFELLVTFFFVLAMIYAVLSGGPTDFARAVAISIPYFLFGLLVVRKGLFAVAILPILISPFFDDRTSHELRLENPQVIFWIAGILLWATAILAGFWVRRWFDR